MSADVVRFALSGEAQHIVKSQQKLISISADYSDDLYWYRHVTLPASFKSFTPQEMLFNPAEWRALGVSQRNGWEHYMLHRPEPLVLLFRRPLSDEEKLGKAKEKERLEEARAVALQLREQQLRDIEQARQRRA